MALGTQTPGTMRAIRPSRTIHLHDASAARDRERGLRQIPRMVRLTVNLQSDLVDKIRNAVYWTPGMTLAWFIGRALCASLAELESVHKGPFPKRLKPLRAGRPRLLGQSMKIQPFPSSHAKSTTSTRTLRPVRSKLV
jgi:hypothetical protein